MSVVVMPASAEPVIHRLSGLALASRGKQAISTVANMSARYDEGR